MTDSTEVGEKAYFVKGGKPGPGRPKGSVSVRPTESIAAFCRTVVGSAEYRQRLWADAVERKLSPAVELMLWDRAYGAVPKEIRVDDVASLDTDALLQRMRAIALALDVTPTVGELESGDVQEPGGNAQGQGE